MTREEITFLLNMKLNDVGDVEKFTNGIRKLLGDMKINPKLQSQIKEIFGDTEKQLDKIQKQIAGGIYDEKGLNNYKTGMQELISLQNQLLSKIRGLNSEQIASGISVNPKEIEAETKAINEAEQAQKNFYNESVNVKKVLEQIASAQGKVGEKETFKKIKKALTDSDFSQLKQIEGYLKRINNIDADPIINALRAAKVEYDGYTQTINTNKAAIAAKAITDKEAASIQELLVEAIKQVVEQLNNEKIATQETSKATLGANRSIDQLISRFEYFFSITNAFRLLGRTVRSAFNTVKELDAAMTETATVTAYSVSEMWDKLDDYTEIANKLGATTLGTYKTITLFFQQGLDEQQSLALATETMKMARVAGIDYAEATQYMTSALRGFNMELNETSATRVNDVYSELAKITAADTEQIAVAMSKVASLANSANMELETTSAILSQIIETTQEAPETAGTALKTIIARFAEVKKLYSEGELTGTDEEGEEVDVNKVSVALRKAGIDLNQFILGNKGLDEIFLELSKKWDTLDLVTQRYIATMAAGSRQQSRFIAMMQDYDRLLELTNAAYTSAGSGQEQFEKTLESLEAKLNKLKNAWDSFTMSIANSTILKGAVDGLTTLLTIVNKLTDAFGGASGALKLFLAGSLAKTVSTLTSPALQAARAAGGDLTNRWAGAQDGFQIGIANLRNQFSSNSEEYFKQQLNELYSKQIGLMRSVKNGGAEAAKELEDVNKKIVDTTRAAERFDAKQFGRQLTAIGIAATAAGSAFKYFGNKVAETNPKLSQALSTIGEIITISGSMITVVGALSQAFPDLGKAISGLGATTLAGIGAALVATITLVQLLVKEIKKAEVGTAALNNSLSTTTNKIGEVLNAIELLNSGRDILDGLAEGSADWYNQLNQVNGQIDALIEKYPELAKYFKKDENGVYYLSDSEGLEEETKRLEKQKEIYTNADLISNESFKKGSFWDFLNNTIIGDLDIGALIKNLDNTKYSKLNLNNIDLKGAYDKAKDLTSGMNSEDIINLIEKSFEVALTDEEKNAGREALQKKYIKLILSQLLEENYQAGIENNEIKESYRDRTGQNKYNAFEGEERTKQLDAAIASNEEAAAWEVYYEQFDNYIDLLGKATNESKAFSLEIADLIKDYENLTKVLSDNEDVLKSGKKEGQAYLLAISRVTVAAQKIYGESLDPDFVSEYAEEFYDAFVDGSEEAIQKINNALINNLDIQSVLDKIEGTSAKWDESTTAAQDFKNALQDLVDHDWTTEPVVDWTSYYTALRDMAGWTEKEFEAVAKASGLEGFFRQNPDGTVSFIVTSAAAPYGGNLRSSSGKSGGKSKKKAWENPYDQLYNLTERNEEAIRRRNILEKEYNAILRDRLGSSSQLLKNSLQELANLQEQLAYQRRLQEGRIAQLNAVEGEMYTNSEGKRQSYADWGVTQYAHYNQQTNAIEIDWDAIDQVTDEEKGKAIEDYIKRLEELQKLYEQTQSDILDIEAAIDEINQRGKKDYLTFEQRIYDAIVKQYQNQIDQFADLSDELDEANQKILDQLNEQIELERQIRDNTKKEEEIADKEARLAYLQRDTSGANQAEILALQKEIEDARQEYSDDLIDQQIEQIQKGNEVASEQRQQQIELMQEQLNYWSENGYFWKTVSDLIAKAINEDGTIDISSDLVDLLMAEENFGGLSEFGKMDWIDTLVKTFMQSMEGFGKFMMEQAENAGTITQNGLTYTYDKEKKAWMLGDEAYSAVYDPATGQYIFTRNPTNDVTTGAIGEPGSGSNGGGSGGSHHGGHTKKYYVVSKNGTELSQGYKTKDEATSYQSKMWNAADKAYEEAKKNAEGAEAERNRLNRLLMQGSITQEEYNRRITLVNGRLQALKNAEAEMNKWHSANIKYYLHGGMADYTGPAWLDGTRTRPEAVLNADQTKLFISLRDILSSLKSRGGRLNELHGDTYVDLDVNANIGSDYDVDSLVARLKRDILESSNYRNANVLSRGY